MDTLYLLSNDSSNSTSGEGACGDGSGEVTSTIYIGVFVAVCGNVLISLGLNVQKHSHNKNETALAGAKRNYLLRRTWWIGFAMMIIGELGNFLAYAFAPASVVAPLGTVALICNAIVAPLVLKERFRLQDLVGILISIGGAILVVIFAKAPECQKTAEEIAQALISTKFLVYAAITVVAIIVLWYYASKYGQKYLLINMSLVGLFGGYTVAATSAVSSLLVATSFWGMFTEWVFYVMLVILVVTAVLQIRFLQQALQNFDSTEVIPAQFVCFTIGAIVCSGVLYDDFKGMAALNIGIFVLGCMLTFFGVYVITQGRTRKRSSSKRESLLHTQESEDSPLITASVTTHNGTGEESFVARFQHMTENTVDAIITGIRAQTILSSKAVDLTYNHLDESDDEEEARPYTSSGVENIPLQEPMEARSRMGTMTPGLMGGVMASPTSSPPKFAPISSQNIQEMNYSSPTAAVNSAVAVPPSPSTSQLESHYDDARTGDYDDDDDDAPPPSIMAESDSTRLV